jgi:hypothetical protein
VEMALASATEAAAATGRLEAMAELEV